MRNSTNWFNIQPKQLYRVTVIYLIKFLAEEYIKNPNAIFLASGMPNINMFPFKEISVIFNDDTLSRLVGQDLSAALQYGSSNGYL